MTQQNILEWNGDGDAPGGEAGTTTRGSLDVSEVPRGSAKVTAAARRLHGRLEERLGVVDLVVTDNRRRMLTTRVRDQRREVRLHHMFLGCDDSVLEAIADLAVGDGDGAREQLREYVQTHRDRIRFRPSEAELEPEGEYFDLQRLLSRVLDLFEPDESRELDDIAITWGRDGRGSKSIQFGSFDFDQRLVRVHPALDREWVPRYFVKFIIYHELLHAVCPPEDGGQNRRVHTDAFARREQEFPRYRDAMEWESENLDKFLDRG